MTPSTNISTTSGTNGRTSTPRTSRKSPAVTPERGEPGLVSSAIHGLLASRGTDAVLHAASEGPIAITLGAI